MNSDEIFENWKQQRRKSNVPEDFALRVLERIEKPLPRRSARWLAAAIVLLAIGSAAIHLAVVLFFTLIEFNPGN